MKRRKKYKLAPYKISAVMREWKEEEQLSFEIPYRYRKGVLEIITTKPGIIIGRAGTCIRRLEEKLQQIDGFKKCEIVHVEAYV